MDIKRLDSWHKRLVHALLDQPLCGVHCCLEPAYSWGETEDGIWKQHGENPEHRRFLRWNESGYAWLLEVHRHEERHDPA